MTLPAADGTLPKPTRASRGIKVYLVIQTINLYHEGCPNRTVLAAKLTRKAAERVRDSIPGTYIEKYKATPL